MPRFGEFHYLVAGDVLALGGVRFVQPEVNLLCADNAHGDLRLTYFLQRHLMAVVGGVLLYLAYHGRKIIVSKGHFLQNILQTVG